MVGALLKALSIILIVIVLLFLLLASVKNNHWLFSNDANTFVFGRF